MIRPGGMSRHSSASLSSCGHPAFVIQLVIVLSGIIVETCDYVFGECGGFSWLVFCSIWLRSLEFGFLAL